MQDPEFHTASGRIDDLLFVREDAEDRVNFIYHGPLPVTLTRVCVGEHEIGVLVGKILEPGAAVAFRKLPSVGARPATARGAGLVVRNGRVIRDHSTAETDASDTAFETTYHHETMDRLMNLVKVSASDEVMDQFLKSRSYGDPSLRAALVQHARDRA